MSSRRDLINEIAKGYYYFLNCLPFDNESYMKGMKEARGKFVANYHIYLSTKDLPKTKKDRRYSTDYVSRNALDLLKKGIVTGLRYEHLVPKAKYINSPCEQLVQNNQILTVESIIGILDKYLWTATITATEEESLPPRTMPEEWDQETIMARYLGVGIELIEHDKSYLIKG